MTSDTLVSVKDVTHRYQSETNPDAPVVLQSVSLEAHPGEFISIVGPSGCGKSTILSLISGLEAPAEGHVEFQGSQVRGPSRDVGFVFQREALLPWKSLRDNVALALRYRKVSKSEANAKADEWLERFGIGALGDRFPYQVSGGQRKRASIAATMVYEPSLMLMDEPFASLDAQTRDIIEDDVLRIWQELGTQTVLFVTHDLEEAVALGTRVVIISRGPGTVIADYAIDLPWPRDVREIRAEAAFRKYTEEVWETLRVEVSATHARGVA
jgi:NitT/TauT family transport system ATP-binding protein